MTYIAEIMLPIIEIGLREIEMSPKQPATMNPRIQKQESVSVSQNSLRMP